MGRTRVNKEICPGARPSKRSDTTVGKYLLNIIKKGRNEKNFLQEGKNAEKTQIISRWFPFMKTIYICNLFSI